MTVKLLEFPHSHYCEKARWVLDFKGVSFEPVAILPGLHMVTVRKYAPNTSVPVLLSDDKIVQGSSEIIEYLDQKYPTLRLTPANPGDHLACLKLEQTIGENLGQNIRRILYSSLLAYPDFIRHCFTHPMPKFKQIFFTLFYPLLRSKIYSTYVISSEKVDDSKKELDAALSELEDKLKQGQYLVGNQFSRADLTVASMLSLLVMPPEHPFPWQEIPDPAMVDFFNQYNDHSVFEWVRTIYRDHR